MLVRLLYASRAVDPSPDVIEDILAERGRPQDNGKEVWLAETWYGYCLAPQRSMDLDSEWLEVVVAFALKESISGVMPSDYGCFLQEGGTPVSYTHLRAHETVLDLVCRLLLEKNNTFNKSYTPFSSTTHYLCV